MLWQRGGFLLIHWMHRRVSCYAFESANSNLIYLCWFHFGQCFCPRNWYLDHWNLSKLSDFLLFSATITPFGTWLPSAAWPIVRLEYCANRWNAIECENRVVWMAIGHKIYWLNEKRLKGHSSFAYLRWTINFCGWSFENKLSFWRLKFIIENNILTWHPVAGEFPKRNYYYPYLAKIFDGFEAVNWIKEHQVVGRRTHAFWFMLIMNLFNTPYSSLFWLPSHADSMFYNEQQKQSQRHLNKFQFDIHLTRFHRVH